MSLVAIKSARRELRASADYPSCDVDRSRLPTDALQKCEASVGLTASDNLSSFFGYLDPSRQMQLCLNADCVRVVSAIKALYPSECEAIGNLGVIPLYARFMDPLERVCRQLEAAKTTSSPTSSPATPPPVQTPAVTVAQPLPSPTSTLVTKSPRTKAPGSPSGDNSGVGEDTQSTTSTAPSGTSSSSPAPSTSSPQHSSSSSSASAGEARNQPVSQVVTPSPSPTPDSGLQQSAQTASSSSAGLMIAIIVAAVVVFAASVAFYIRRRKQGREAKSTRNASTNTTANCGSHNPDSSVSLESLLKPLMNWRMLQSDITDVKIIGSGAQGLVYLVKMDGGRPLASKRLISNQLTQQRLEAFVAEIELVVSLNHRSIVQFVGVAWTTTSDLQALFEYMPNGDLRMHLDRTKPPQPQPWTHTKLKMALQIAEGLVYVHSFNPPIVHRDLKARNVLLDVDMNAKISDFGVSRFQSEQGTMTTGVGTSRWLASEVIKGGGRYTEQCDIYSFGIVLTEMDTHDLPFADSNLSEITLLHQVAKGTLRPRISNKCDPSITTLIEQCLSVEPDQRPNALETSYRLRKILKAFECEQN